MRLCQEEGEGGLGQPGNVLGVRGAKPDPMTAVGIEPTTSSVQTVKVCKANSITTRIRSLGFIPKSHN